MSARLVLGPFSGSAPSRLSFPLMLLKGLRHASQVAFVSSGAQEQRYRFGLRSVQPEFQDLFPIQNTVFGWR
jgi:hypothetical protein